MTNPNYTHLAFIVDRSGSMSNIASDMEGAIKTTLAEQAKIKGELHVDIWTFDTVVEHPFKDARPDDVKAQIIVPRNATALNDALVVCIVELGERFAVLPEDERPGKVIITVVTDGLENSSHENPGQAGKDRVKALVEKQRTEFAWEFLFFGASSIDAFAAADDYGIARAQTISFGDTRQAVHASGLAASSYMTSSRAGDVRGFTEEERAAAAGEDEEE